MFVRKYLCYFINVHFFSLKIFKIDKTFFYPSSTLKNHFLPLYEFQNEFVFSFILKWMEGGIISPLVYKVLFNCTAQFSVTGLKAHCRSSGVIVVCSSKRKRKRRSRIGSAVACGKKGKRTMANQGAKKRKEENARHMARLRQVIIACNVLSLILLYCDHCNQFFVRHCRLRT